MINRGGVLTYKFVRVSTPLPAQQLLPPDALTRADGQF